MSNPAMDEVKADESVNQPTQDLVEAVNPVESQDSSEFTAEDRTLLETQEGVIASNIGAFLSIGEALSLIKGRGLHKITEPDLTFEQYCSKRWGFGDKYAYRLINGFDCVANLKAQMTPNNVTVFPTNEAQVRPLTSLPSPKDQVKAWDLVLKKAKGDSITAAMVEAVVARLTSKSVKPLKKAPKKAAAEVEQRKLKAIKDLVAEAKKFPKAKVNAKQWKGFLIKLEKLLKSRRS